jgi:RNA polymerase sigma-70 factor, ECF subfamily
LQLGGILAHPLLYHWATTEEAMNNQATATATADKARKQQERKEELDLLAAVLSGDSRASKRFVQCYTPVIEARVRRILFGARGRVAEDDIQDMVGEIWVSLLDNDMRPLRRFNPNRQIKVSTWVGLLARNKTIDKLRTTHGRTISMEDFNGGHEPPSPSPLPHELLERHEYRAMASEAVSQLNPEDQHFMKAWYSEEIEPEQLAVMFGIAIGTVYSRRFKIQAKLARTVKRLNRPDRITQRIMRR